MTTPHDHSSLTLPDGTPGATSSVADRVHWLATAMADGSYPPWPATRGFREALARRWGVAESSVRQYSAEAHRLLSFPAEEREQMRAEIARRFNRIAEAAMSTHNSITGLPDFQSAIKALCEFGRYLGLEPETKLQHTGAITLDSIDELRARIGNVGAPQLRIGDERDDAETEATTTATTTTAQSREKDH